MSIAANYSQTKSGFYSKIHHRGQFVKERPILGIDYDKLRKTQHIQRGENQQLLAPQDSLHLNQTSHSFRSTYSKRPSTNASGDRPQNMQRSFKALNKQALTISSDQLDFETFKKHKAEFEEFRKIKASAAAGSSNGFQQPYLAHSASMKTTSANTSPKVYFQENITNERESNERVEQKSDANGQLRKLFTSQVRPKTSFKRGNQSELVKSSQGDKCDEQSQEGIGCFFDTNQNATAEQFGVSTKESDNQPSEENFQATDQSVYSSVAPYQKMVDQYVDRNTLYFKHLSGDCPCGRCLCGKCKCPFKQIPFKLGANTSHQTMYKSNFQHWKNLQSFPSITMDFHTQMAPSSEHIKTCSTSQSDFKIHNTQEIGMFKPDKTVKAHVPFLATSSYKSNFIDWKQQLQQDGTSKHVKAPREDTVVHDAPFIGRSSYADSFTKKTVSDKDLDDFIKSKSITSLKSPLSADFTYFRETTNQFQFKKQNPAAIQTMIKPFQGKVEITPAAPSQYQSQGQHDMSLKQPIVCPSRAELNLMRSYKS